MSLPQCAALRRHHLTINSVTLDFLNYWMYIFSFSSNLLIHRSILSMALPAINGSKKHNALALLKLLSFCFSLPSSSLECFASLCYHLLLVAILHLLMVYQWTSYCLSVLPFFVWFFVITESSVSKYGLQFSSFFSKLDILPSSCHSRYFSTVITFTATAGFT